MNRIQEFAKERGCKSGYRFWQQTGLPQATAYRLWRDASVWPDKGNVQAICEAFDAQPGEFLYVAEIEGGDRT